MHQGRPVFVYDMVARKPVTARQAAELEQTARLPRNALCRQGTATTVRQAWLGGAGMPCTGTSRTWPTRSRLQQQARAGRVYPAQRVKQDASRVLGRMLRAPARTPGVKMHTSLQRLITLDVCAQARRFCRYTALAASLELKF